MGNRKSRKRSDIESQYKWDIEAMYDSDEKWESDLADCVERAKSFAEMYKGHLGESAETLAGAMKESDSIGVVLERAYVYSRMKLDEDNTVAKQQAMYNKAVAVISQVSALTSFVTPEIKEIPDETLLSFIASDDDLKTYEFALKESMRSKAHVLSEKEENILAQLGEVLGAPNTIFTMIDDADMKFGKIKDENGEETELTHGNYITFMRSHDRAVRKDAFEHTYTAYKNQINTIAANYGYSVKTDCIGARLRHYGSAREQALFGGNIPASVYDNLVQQVNDSLPVLHDYIATRKKLLGVDELKMYDVYVPLVNVPKRDIPFDQAIELANKGLAVLGDEYLTQFNQGVKDRWIDIYENEGKTSGAYSFGSYDSMPYVLMNYDNTIEDLFTVVHEMGHSMNSWYTRRTQPYIYGDHAIFTAEVASTVNETLMMRWLLENERDPEMKKYILNMYIEAFRTTLFRQTMFAEFEDATHKYTESGESLTADWMNKTYDDLNTKYFGDALSHDDFIQYEWARIPHFYNAFYVYQYATGYSAANAIADRLLTEGEPARRDYIEFLKNGTNDFPVEILKIAGVDMSSPEPVAKAMNMFKKLVDEFKALV
ncbi:MAG: oligoendopeptidase F [Eubacteriales bacterium]|nr:oligoendopeptidase F [Eubacteriales bacterium]